MFTILGAGGLIGSAMARHLQSQGHEVRSVTRDNWPGDGEELGHVIYAIGVTSNFFEPIIQTAFFPPYSPRCKEIARSLLILHLMPKGTTFHFRRR
jgi:nucleoside-diphosphate-sugar epimerase